MINNTNKNKLVFTVRYPNYFIAIIACIFLFFAIFTIIKAHIWLSVILLIALGINFYFLSVVYDVYPDRIEKRWKLNNKILKVFPFIQLEKVETLKRIYKNTSNTKMKFFDSKIRVTNLQTNYEELLDFIFYVQQTYPHIKKTKKEVL